MVQALVQAAVLVVVHLPFPPAGGAAGAPEDVTGLKNALEGERKIVEAERKKCQSIGDPTKGN